MAYTFTPLEIPGLLLVQGKTWPDGRGYFQESYREIDMREAGLPPFLQDNLSRSTQGTVRGLHYQKHPAAIGKLLRCTRGKIFDVAVDIRKGSPAYGRWFGIELEGGDNKMLWVPAGFAHGFYTLSDVADVLYKVTGYYAPEQDRGIIWNDPALGITWPAKEAILSPKDAKHPPLSEADNNFVWEPHK